MDDTQTPQPTTTSPATPDVMEVLELEKAIKTYHAGVYSKREELKKLNEMISDTLENDQVYYEQGEKVKEAKAVQQKTKEQLLSVPSVIQAQEEIKELRGDMKDIQKLLSESLMKYYRLSGQESITMEDGQTYVIEISAKLGKQK